jgi:hypothetical protein
VSFPIGATIGFFLGFAFGVGCALAVLFSIYMGGYRAAVADADRAVAPKRLVQARAKLAVGQREARAEAERESTR